MPTARTYNEKIFSRKVILRGVLDPKGGGSAPFQNICKPLPIDTT
jgi:hypothetical protein